MLKKLSILLFVICCLINGNIFAQNDNYSDIVDYQLDLPEGWDVFSPNPSSETFIMLDNVFPTIEGTRLQHGDYIGAFYLDGGEYKCGGAIMYDTTQANNVTIYGDDSMTEERDGFHVGDSIYWKLYLTQYNITYDAHVEYAVKPFYSASGHFATLGIAEIINMATGNFRVYTYVSEYNSCQSDDVTITVSCTISGGSGDYDYLWTTYPQGTTYNQQEIELVVEETTLFEVTVTDNQSYGSTKGYTKHFIVPQTAINFTSDTLICGNHLIMLNPEITNAREVKWTTNGDGYFNNTTIEHPIYYPGSNDISTRHVDLTLKAYSKSPCFDTAIHTVSVDFSLQPTASMEIPEQICHDQSAELTATVNNAASFEWATRGDGYFSDIHSNVTTYYPGSADISNRSVVLSILAYPENGDCFDTVEVFNSLSITGLPSSSLEDTIRVCEGSACVLNHYAGYYDTLFWTTSGDGFFYNDNTYFPGEEDIANGHCDLTLFLTSLEPCDDTASFTTHIVITPLPTVNIDDSLSVCSTDTLFLTLDVENYSAIEWFTDGDGVFGNADSANAYYVPGMTDVENGTCNIHAEIQPLQPCTVLTTKNVHVTIHSLAVFAGNDTTLCSDNTLELSGENINAEETLWTSSGDGFFDDANALSTTYHLGENDIATGGVLLVLTGQAEECYNTASDSMYLTIVKKPEIDALHDTAVCKDNDLQLSAAVNNYSSLTWITDGDGYFSEDTILNPTYHFGENDILLGSVNLMVMLEGHSPCVNVVTDTMNVSVITIEQVDAGENQSIMIGSKTTLTGFVQGDTSQYLYSWAPAHLVDFPNALVTTTKSILQNTTFTLTMTDKLTACQTFDTTDVDVYGELLSIDLYPLTGTSLCSGDSVMLTVLISGGDTANYNIEWTSSPEGFVSGDDFISAILYDTTTFTVTVSDGISTLAESIVINVSPLPITNAGEDITAYPGLSVTLNGNVDCGSGNCEYHWYPSYLLVDNTVANPQTVPLYSTTVFFLLGQDADSRCSSVDTMIVYVQGQPFTLGITTSNDSICSGETVTLEAMALGGSEEYQYSWSSEPEGFHSSQRTINVMPSSTTTYFVEVDDGFSTLSSSITIHVSEGIEVDAGENITIHAGGTASLSGVVTGGSGDYSIQWQPGELLDDATILNPTTLPVMQTTVFTLNVTDVQSGCTDSDSVIVNVIGDPLNVTINASSTALCNGESTTLQATATGGNGNYTYSWSSQPSGFTSTQPSVQVSPTVTTNYVVIVDDGENTATDSVTIVVNDNPVAFAGNDVTTFYNGVVTLHGSASGNGSYSYIWAPAELLNNPYLQNPTTVNLTETTTFTLTVTDNVTGCEGSDMVTVTVAGDPLSVVVTAEPDTIFIGGSSSLNAVVTGGSGDYDYSWTSQPAGFTSQQQNPVVTPTETTKYILTVNDGFSTSQDEITIVVNPLPIELVVTAEPDTVCHGESSVLNVEATGGTGNFTYVWSSANGGMISQNQSVTITPNMTTTYNVMVSDGISSETGSVTVVVNTKPTTFAGNDSTIYAGTTAHLHGTITDGSGDYDVVWTPEEFFVDNTVLNPVTIPLTETVTFTLTCVDNVTGCQNSDNVKITVMGEVLEAEIEVADTELCFGDNTVLSAMVSGGTGSYHYSWTSVPEGFTSDEPSIEVAPTQSTMYKVVVTDNYSQVADSVQIIVYEEIITTITPAVDTIDFGATITFVAESNVENTEFLWLPYNISGNTLVLDTNMYQLGNNTISVVTTDEHGCETTQSTSFYVKESDGIIIVEDGEISIYPNPFNDRIFITSEQSARIVIYNATGQIVYSASPERNEKIEIDTNSWKSGMYFVKINESVFKTLKIK